MREEEKLEGGWEEVITNSWERRHGKGRNHLLPLCHFYLILFLLLEVRAFWLKEKE